MSMFLDEVKKIADMSGNFYPQKNSTPYWIFSESQLITFVDRILRKAQDNDEWTWDHD